MEAGFLEHVNITVSDPQKTAQILTDVFGWQVRWQGQAQSGGLSVHVGTDKAYIALWGPVSLPHEGAQSEARGGLNHVGIAVGDLDAAEERIKAFGFETYFHGSYVPGRRFYFRDHDGIEWEVVSYA